MFKAIKEFRAKKNLKQISVKAKAEKTEPNRLVDRALYEVYLQYLSNHPNYSKDYSKEELKKFVNINNLSILISNSYLHETYIEKIKDVYQKEYFKTTEELEKKFSLSDFKILEYVSAAKSDAEIEEEYRKNKKILKNKYELCKAHSIIPLRGLNDNKKYLGVLVPSLAIKNFWFEDIVFISPEIISDCFFVRGLEFLEKDIVEEKITSDEIINLLLQFMVDQNYSDISYGLKDRTSYMIKGRKAGADVEILQNKMNQKTADKITGELLKRTTGDRKNTKSTVSGTITQTINGKQRTFRITAGRQSKAGVSRASFHRVVSIRILADNGFIEDIKNLRLGEDVNNFLTKSVMIKGGGMFIFAGETNSSKTTTMMSVLRHAQKNANIRQGKDLNIITVDNGMEYCIDGMYQYDVLDTLDTDDPLTFVEAIKVALRQDPDIFAVGEARSQEELELCANAGSRGAPVFMTLHSSSPQSAVQIFENVGKVDKIHFAGNIRMICHLNLENALCQECKGDGCLKCNGTGESGRIPIYDFIYVYPPSYGKDTFDIHKDDIYNLAQLEKDKKIFRITKAQRAKDLYDNGWIRKDTYELYSGDSIKQAIATLQDKQSKEMPNEVA